MKKSNLNLLCVCSIIMSLSGCNVNKNNSSITNNNPAYVDVKDLNPDATYTFTSNLEKKTINYPLSTGKVYYVSENGDDKNDGLSMDKPLKTFKKVSSLSLNAGDSVLFKKGDTFTGTLSLNNLIGDKDNPITIASYGEGEDRPILTNTKDYPHLNVITLLNSSCVVIRDLKIDVYGYDRVKRGGSVCSTGICVNYNYVENEKFSDIYIMNNVLRGHAIDSTYEDYDCDSSGIVFSSLEKTHDSSPLNILKDVYVMNNDVSHFGRVGIQCGGWIEEKGGQNEMHRNKYSYVHFDENLVHHIGGLGMYIAASQYSTLNRNHVYETGITKDKNMIEGQCGLMYLSSEYSECKYNIAHDIYDGNTGWDAMGIDIDWNTDHITVDSNYLYDCMGSGVGTMANQNSIISYNRIERARGETNHDGSITLDNFTCRFYPVPDDFHSITNAKIYENLVIHNDVQKPVFHVRENNGDKDYYGNEFTDNHLLFNGNANPDNLTWINVQPTLNWYKFANNKYYAETTNMFKAFDATPYADINYQEGASTYIVSKEKPFSNWEKRDQGATFEKITSLIPSAPINPEVVLENNKLKFTWEKAEDEVVIWKYNIYKIKENESPSYLNMVGQTKELSFEYEVDSSNDYYYVIQPESNEGIYGKALKLKVSL